MEFLYLPLSLYVFFIGSIKAGKLFYFAAANPKIPLGGFANDSKFSIIKKIPEEFKPQTILILKSDNSTELLVQIKNKDFRLPLFVKPDIGEGGFLAKKINKWEELLNYHSDHNMDYMIQEFIKYPVELSILIHNANCDFKISSITERKYLTLEGDGFSSLKILLKKERIAKFRLRNIFKHCQGELENILEKGKKYQPISIGNFDFGAKYLERTELATECLLKTIHRINTKINLFNYARYDIKCKSFDDLLAGNMKILEINGVKGEPIHIYDSKYTLLQAYKEIFKHWGYIMIISKRNISSGIICPTPLEGFKMLWTHLQTKKTSLLKRNFHEQVEIRKG
jgi:hypothetical protein